MEKYLHNLRQIPADLVRHFGGLLNNERAMTPLSYWVIAYSLPFVTLIILTELAFQPTGSAGVGLAWVLVFAYRWLRSERRFGVAPYAYISNEDCVFRPLHAFTGSIRTFTNYWLAATFVVLLGTILAQGTVVVTSLPHLWNMGLITLTYLMPLLVVFEIFRLCMRVVFQPPKMQVITTP